MGRDIGQPPILRRCLTESAGEPVYRARLFFAGVPAVELASTARVIAVED
jgi:hypothetical protein